VSGSPDIPNQGFPQQSHAAPQWDYPYGAGPTFVGEGELAQVGPPRPQLAARDPRRATLAAVITFVCMIFALWAVLGFLGSMAKTLSNVSRGTASVRLQLQQANAGLATLDAKTGALDAMKADTGRLGGSLGAIDTDMGVMVTDVDSIATSMQAMKGSLDTLDGQLGGINDINARMAPKLGTINTGLGHELAQVRAMRKDVVATKGVLGTVPGRLNVTNGRLTWVNSTINYFGCTGLSNTVGIRMTFLGIPNGTAKISAAITPKGAWGTNPDGTPCR
jgi:hypothetical protein